MRSMMLATACAATLVLMGCGKAEGSADAPSLEKAEVAAPVAATEAKPATVPAGAATTALSAAAPQRAVAYTPMPISAEDQPGRARHIRCQVGAAPETDCTFTPLFGDGSFQLDGPDIAYRMVISDGEGVLFNVLGPEKRVPIWGSYRRDARDGACWIRNESTPAPTPICAR